MPRNISFSMTTPQVIARTKTVTRRMGWLNLRKGDVLCGVEKGQGLKKGEKVRRLCMIRVVDVRREPLNQMLANRYYGKAEVCLEGFPTMSPEEFVSMFCRGHDCWPSSTVTRIKFTYLDEGP